MKLNNEQKNAISKLVQCKKSIQTLGGFAGTGKSTVIYHLHQVLDNFAICAYTGKAANVLRKKNIPATTIHSLIYVPETDKDGNIIIDEEEGLSFSLAKDLDCDGIIIDEASMVSEEIFNDLCTFGIPLIFVGDHGQLEPVGDKFNLMDDPEYKLETVHRNAGEIAHFAEYIRKGFSPPSFGNRFSVKNIHFANSWDYEKHLLRKDEEEYDDFQIICAFNKKRVEINKKIRSHLGRNPDWPEELDKVMCLKNDRETGLFNGMQGYVDYLFKKPKNKFCFQPYGENEGHEVLFNPTQFNKEKNEFERDQSAPHPFDYAYAITCHKSQGDEWKEVMVFDQKCDLWSHVRWAYTAASRAKEKIIWVS
jgi:ATP-dependent exoDNAse (exonuclease V) alpha subunit